MGSSGENTWNTLGNALVGAAAGDAFGHSISMSADGVTVAVGAPGNNDNGPDSGHVRLFVYSSSENTWNTLGNTLVGAASDDQFGRSVSMSADGMTVAVGAPNNDDNGYSSGHVRLFVYSSTENTWNTLGNNLVGAASRDYFGWSVSMSADGMTVAGL